MKHCFDILILLWLLLVSIFWSFGEARVSDDTQIQKDITTLYNEVNELRKKIDLFSEYCKLVPETECGPCRCRDDDRLVKKYYCDCQHLTPERDCLEFYRKGFKINGVYKVHQNNIKIIQVYCDQTTDGGGWTVFQRRTDGSVDFYCDWYTYKVGFGQLNNEFWLGNENLFTMIVQAILPKGSELRIEMEDWAGVRKYAKYHVFQVGNENINYKIHVNLFSGTSQDSLMQRQNGRPFSTYDRDNDILSINCARTYKGGWWYSNCHWANLNGRYYKYQEMGSPGTGIHWNPFHGDRYSLKFVEMKMRRKI